MGEGACNDGDEDATDLLFKNLDGTLPLLHKSIFPPLLLLPPPLLAIIETSVAANAHTRQRSHEEPSPPSCLSNTAMFPTPRSASLPPVAPLPDNGPNLFHSIARKDSRSIAPMTPPMSPTERESRMDVMQVDHPIPHSRDSDVDHLSIQDLEIDSELLPIHPPIRTLEESRECLPRSLRLTDFEVRGTLGMSSPHPLAFSSPPRPFTNFHPHTPIRCRNVWACVARSTP